MEERMKPDTCIRTHVIKTWNMLCTCIANIFCLHCIQVRCIKWSPDDMHLLSCSMDGAVYDWSVQTCKRDREYVLKSCSYTSLAFTSDLKTTFAVGSDRTLNQINLQDSSVSRREWLHA